jgi:hypothetical protein
MTAVHVMCDRVWPFYDEHGAKSTTSSPAMAGSAAGVRRTILRTPGDQPGDAPADGGGSPETNGFCQRFHQTVAPRRPYIGRSLYLLAVQHGPRSIFF